MRTNKFNRFNRKSKKIRKIRQIRKSKKTKVKNPRKSKSMKRNGGAALAQAALAVGESTLAATTAATSATSKVVQGVGVATEIAGVGIKEALINSSEVSFGILNNSIKFTGDVNKGLFGTLKTIYKTGEFAGLILNKILDTCAILAVDKIKELDEISAKYLNTTVGYDRNTLYPIFLKNTYSEIYKHYTSLFYSIKNVLQSDKQNASSHLLQLKCIKDWRWNVTCSKIEELFVNTEKKNGLYADSLYSQLNNQHKLLKPEYRKYIAQFNTDYKSALSLVKSGFSTSGDINKKNKTLKIIVTNFMNKYNTNSEDIPEAGIKKAQIYSKVFDPIIIKSSELLKKISELSREAPGSNTEPIINDEGKKQIQEIKEEKEEIDKEKNTPINNINIEEITKKYTLGQKFLKGLGIGTDIQEKEEISSQVPPEVPGEITPEVPPEVPGEVPPEVPGQVPGQPTP
jgi:hypothetical protein